MNKKIIKYGLIGIFYIVFLLVCGSLITRLLWAYSSASDKINVFLLIIPILIMLLFVIGLTSIPITIFIFIFSKRFRGYKSKIMYSYILWILVTLVPLYTGVLITGWNTDKNMKLGDDVITSLKTYKSTNGQYPASLNDLSLNVPTTVEGIEFEYVSNGTNYRLYFIELMRRIEFDSELNRWEYYD